MFDYIVIGSGSAGSVLAGRLSEDPQVRVCLIEAGGPDSSVLVHCPAGLAVMAKTGANNWKLATTPQAGLGGRRGYQPRGKVLGGSSSVNAMIYTRGHASDYDYWAEQGNTGWGWSDVLPYFKRAENNERGEDAMHGAGGPLNVADLRSPNPLSHAFVDACAQAGHERNDDFNGAQFEGAGLYQVTHRNGERFSAAKAYLTPHLASRSNLQVVTGAQVTRILMEGKRAIGVQYWRNGGMHSERVTREVLLCAGAFFSPQLLMLSGIGNGAALQQLGIDVVHDLPGVGEHLHDHPDVVTVVDAPERTESFGLSVKGAMNLISGILEWRNQRTGMLTTNFAEAGGFIKSSAQQAIPDLQLHFVVGKLIDHGRKTVWGHGYSSHICLLQPKSRGRVTLKSADALVPPLIDPAYFSDPEDLHKMIDAVKLMRHILSQPALRSLGGAELAYSANAQSDEQIAQYIRDYADTIYHPVGTCRMGSSPMDVVDSELRVHGVEGLRVVDASIMPRIVSGNTNAPVIMIAEKAVDLIRARAT